jgi:hypothetical protein
MNKLDARARMIDNAKSYIATGEPIYAYLSAGHALCARCLPPEHVCETVGPLLSGLAKLTKRETVSRDDILHALALMPSTFGEARKDGLAFAGRSAAKRTRERDRARAKKIMLATPPPGTGGRAKATLKRRRQKPA